MQNREDPLFPFHTFRLELTGTPWLTLKQISTHMHMFYRILHCYQALLVSTKEKSSRLESFKSSFWQEFAE